MSALHKVRVDDKGTEIAYLDSGALPGDSYTTLVCVHGHSYHAQNFSRLFPIAEKYNLRIIALNRRDYVGSTPFSEEELQILKEGDEGPKGQFMKDRGLEVARFLVWVINELKIPPVSDDGKTGGLALLGWSLGNITTMAFLANLKTYPEDIVKHLEPYLHTFLMYDLPDNCLGYPQPQEYYHPFEDTSIPERIRGIVFGKWVSSYYEHPAYSSGSTPDSASQSNSVFPSKGRSLDALQLRAPKKAARPCTLDKLTPRELLDSVDAAPGVRSEWAMWRFPSSLLHSQKCRALLLEPESGSITNGVDPTRSVLPNLKIRVICGLASLWVVQWESWAFEDEVQGWVKEGKKMRQIKFLPVENANHFMHWDDAEIFMKLCSDNIKS